MKLLNLYILLCLGPVCPFFKAYFAHLLLLELVVRLALHINMAWVKKHLLPIYTFMHATVTTIVTICNNHISLKNDRSL